MWKYDEDERMISLHVSSVPVFKNEKARSFLNLSSQLVRSLDPKWRQEILEVTTEGETLMTKNFVNRRSIFKMRRKNT